MAYLVCFFVLRSFFNWGWMTLNHFNCRNSSVVLVAWNSETLWIIQFSLNNNPLPPYEQKIVPGLITFQGTTVTTSKQLKFYQEALEAMMATWKATHLEIHVYFCNCEHFLDLKWDIHFIPNSLEWMNQKGKKRYKINRSTNSWTDASYV